MIIETKYEYGDIVEEVNSGYKGKVTSIETDITGIAEVDEASQCYLVVKHDSHGIPERRWISYSRLRKVEE